LILPWLFPVGLLGMVALIALSSVLGLVLAAVWAWIAFPCVGLFVRSRADRRTGETGDADTRYWRTTLM
jgi:hypothetical protein